MTNEQRNSSSGFIAIAPATGKRSTLSTEDYLKRNSEAICNETLNNRNFESPSLAYLAPEVLAIHETTPISTGREILIENLRSMMERMPDYHADILNSTAAVNERKGTAAVYLHLFLTGMPDGIRRESVNVLDWVRRGGVWQIVRHSGMRGPPSDGRVFTGV